MRYQRKMIQSCILPISQPFQVLQDYHFCRNLIKIIRKTVSVPLSNDNSEIFKKKLHFPSDGKKI